MSASLLALALISSAGCQSTGVVPEPLASQVDRSVTFDQVKQSPEAYQGRFLVLGGEVLSARRLKDGTRLEILHLPLDRKDRPLPDRTQSAGRFFAISKEPLDPATLTGAVPITLVGEVTGSQMGQLDEALYRYPVVEIHHLTVWYSNAQPRPYATPGVGIGIGGGYGTGRGFGGVGFGLGF